MAVTWRITDEQRRPQRRAKDFVLRMGRIQNRVKKRINAANEKSAELLAAMITRLAPKDEGDLIASIRYFEVTGTVGGGITWRVTEGDDTAFYSRMVEFGGKNRAAKPHFFPSYRALRRSIRNRQLRAFKQGLKDSET